MRKTYPPRFKAQLVLEMIREEKSVSALASEHGIHPTMLHRWRNQVLENLHQVFAEGETVETVKTDYEQKIEQLYVEIGRLTTQLAWLGKKGFRVE